MGIAQVLMPISIIGSLGMSLYYFTKVLTDYILKKKMIEKGYVNEDAQAIFKQQSATNKYNSLKWGLLALTGGLALIILEFIDVRRNSPLPYGLVAVALSTGFLVYYAIIKKELNK